MSFESHPVPASQAALTPAWLRSVLAGRFPAANPTSAGTERIGQDFGLSSELYRCRLTGPGHPRSVIAKLWSTDGPAGVNEVLFYDSFARNLGIRVPACYHGAVDRESGRGVLVLEDLEDVVQGDCLRQLDAGGAAALARVIAALHATWWRRPELRAAEWLPPVITREPEWLRSRRESFLRRFDDRIDPAIRLLLERVEAVQARANERLDGAAMTLLHADLHLDNVVFEGGGGHPILLDWARVAQGPAVIDLAELLFAIAPPGEVEPLLDVYLGELCRRGITELPDDAIRRQLGGALLRRFVSATCGVARWQPASERERQMIALGFQRITRAIETWRRIDPELLHL